MAGASRWSMRYDYWKSMPTRSHVLFLTGVFFLFLPAGLLTDISHLGRNGPVRLLVTAIGAGAIAVAYVAATRQRPWGLPLVIGLHVVYTIQFDRLVGPMGPPLTGEALQARLAADVNASITAIVLGFVLLSQLIRREAVRYGRIRAEIALAGDIHRLLVPRIEKRVSKFELRGVSLPSGEVGGDLIDLVESPIGWTGFVADVSGHGVAAGLLMGMLKSAARTQFRVGERIDAVLNTLNTVLVDLTSPAMFVTFAGLQSEGGSALRFTVAGHLPILHYRASVSEITDLSISQLPLAMFSDRSFTSSSVAYEPGDLFVILTDGLTEVFDRADREFGLDGVKALIREHARGPLALLEDRLLAAVRAHGPQLDDQTLLLIRAVA